MHAIKSSVNQEGAVAQMFLQNLRSVIHPALSIFSAKGKGSGGVKTAKLYAWVALQTLPEEMVISPCLLDFLEKALETIPITPVERSYAGLFFTSHCYYPFFIRLV